MPAFFVINLNMPDPNVLKQYEELATPALQKYNVEVLTRGTPSDYDVIEGDWKPPRLVIIQYASVHDIFTFYDDPDYQPAKRLRLGTPGNSAGAIAFEGIAGVQSQDGAFFVTDLTVTSSDALAAFETEADAMVLKHGGRFLVRTGMGDVLEGHWKPQRMIIEAFADRKSIHAMYDDPDNQPLIAKRQAASMAKALAVNRLRN